MPGIQAKRRITKIYLKLQFGYHNSVLYTCRDKRKMVLF